MGNREYTIMCDKRIIRQAVLGTAPTAPAPCAGALCIPVLPCSKEPNGRSSSKIQRTNRRSQGFGAPAAPSQYCYSTWNRSSCSLSK